MHGIKRMALKLLQLIYCWFNGNLNWQKVLSIFLTQLGINPEKITIQIIYIYKRHIHFIDS